jgi:tetratricopeptide (TPR) repeat protein
VTLMEYRRGRIGKPTADQGWIGSFLINGSARPVVSDGHGPDLRAVATMDEAILNEALGKLEEANLASCRGRPPDAIYSFKHALVQDTAYTSLLKTRRQALHRQIAEALRDHFSSLADAEPEIIAHHFTQAGLPEQALEWWTKAGELALRRSAYVEAVSHYNSAIAQAEQLSESPPLLRHRLRLQIACGQALISARGYGAPETTAAFTRAHWSESRSRRSWRSSGHFRLGRRRLREAVAQNFCPINKLRAAQFAGRPPSPQKYGARRALSSRRKPAARSSWAMLG